MGKIYYKGRLLWVVFVVVMFLSRLVNTMMMMIVGGCCCYASITLSGRCSYDYDAIITQYIICVWYPYSANNYN